jgi:hypothetical protein
MHFVALEWHRVLDGLAGDFDQDFVALEYGVDLEEAEAVDAAGGPSMPSGSETRWPSI